MKINVLDNVQLLDGTKGIVTQWEENHIAKVFCGHKFYGPLYKYVSKEELTKI